jgi:hypothetical protein
MQSFAQAMYAFTSYGFMPECCDTTSRKHGKTEPQLFSHCGSFDHPDLQSINEMQICFFGLPTEILRIWELLIYL